MFAYLLSLMSGFLVKSVDHLEDDLKHKSKVKYLLAIAYGIVIGVLISRAPFSTLFLAALLAQVFTEKVDCRSHVVGFFVAIMSLIAFGLPSLDLTIFSFFFLLAMIDEVEWMGKLGFIGDYRPFLKLGGLVLLYFGQWYYFAGIILFDIGYLLATELYKDEIHLRF